MNVLERKLDMLNGLHPELKKASHALDDIADFSDMSAAHEADEELGTWLDKKQASKKTSTRYVFHPSFGFRDNLEVRPVVVHPVMVTPAQILGDATPEQAAPQAPVAVPTA